MRVQRKSKYNPMLEVTSAASVQVSGSDSSDHSRGCHFRQKILELRQAEAKRKMRRRTTGATAEAAIN